MISGAFRGRRGAPASPLARRRFLEASIDRRGGPQDPGRLWLLRAMRAPRRRLRRLLGRPARAAGARRPARRAGPLHAQLRRRQRDEQYFLRVGGASATSGACTCQRPGSAPRQRGRRLGRRHRRGARGLPHRAGEEPRRGGRAGRARAHQRPTAAPAQLRLRAGRRRRRGQPHRRGGQPAAVQQRADDGQRLRPAVLQRGLLRPPGRHRPGVRALPVHDDRLRDAGHGHRLASR